MSRAVQKWPYVTMGLAAICVLVFLYELTLGQEASIRFTLDYALIPERLVGDYVNERFAHTPPWLTLVTSIFLHGGEIHLLVNMLVLISFGIVLEREIGIVWFLILFFAAGIVGGLLHTVMASGQELRIPVVGASGAISGVLAAAFLSNPRQRIVLVVVPMPFWIAMVVLIAAHIVFIVTDWLPGVAWWAHLGGFAAGAALYPLMRRGPMGRPFT